MHKIITVAVIFFSLNYSAAIAQETPQEAMSGTAETLIALANMTPSVDSSVGDSTAALDIARATGNSALAQNAEKHLDLFRAIGLIETSATAERKSDLAAGAVLKAHGCKIAAAMPSDKERAERLKKVAEFCASIDTSVSLSDESQVELYKIVGVLIAGSRDLAEQGRADMAIGFVTAALDIAHMITDKRSAAFASDLLLVYRAQYLASVAGTIAEAGNVQSATGIRSLSCAMAGGAAKEFAAMLEKARTAACGLSV